MQEAASLNGTNGLLCIERAVVAFLYCARSY